MMDHKEKMGIFWDSILHFWVPLIEDSPAFPQKFPSCLKNNIGLYNLIWSHYFLLPLSKLVPENQITWRAHNWSLQNPIWSSWGTATAPSPESCFDSFFGFFFGGGARKELTFSLYSNRWPLMSAYEWGITMNCSQLFSYLSNRKILKWTTLKETSSQTRNLWLSKMK